MAKAGHARFKPFFDFLLASGGDAREGAAVKRIDRGQDLETAFFVAKFAAELEQAFIGLSAAVAKENFARSDLFDDGLGEAALRLVIVKIGNVTQFLGLANQRIGDFGIGVTEAENG